MRKLTGAVFISLDGVMQAPGGPEEDPTSDFRHGGWVQPYWSEEMGPFEKLIDGEYDLLLELAGRNDVTVSDRTVDVHVSHLRKKLGDDPPRLIRTVRGVGYMFARDDA